MNWSDKAHEQLEEELDNGTLTLQEFRHAEACLREEMEEELQQQQDESMRERGW